MNNTFFDTRTKNLITVVLSALALFLLIEVVSVIYTISNTHEATYNTITVRGEAEVKGIPDIAQFSFTVRETGKTSAEATDKMSTKANTAIAYLKQNGIQEKDIATESLVTNPTYEYTQGICTANACAPSKQTITGYESSQSIVVKARDIKKGGSLLAGITALKINETSRLSLTVDSPDELKLKAKTEAITKAQHEAKVLADTLHVRLGKVTSYYEELPSQGDVYPRAMSDKASNFISSVAPDIQPGEQTFTSVVSISYEIK